jgi:predicted extracellular nuclease
MKSSSLLKILVMKITQFRLVLLCSITIGSCASAQQSSKSKAEEAIVAFYNVENLFDTLDDARTMDEDFTPTGKLQWTAPRYAEKLSRISEVIEMLPGELPIFIGLCEIENRTVLEDLVKEKSLHSASGNRGYEIIHGDSPDERGIDAAALYNAAILKNVSFEYHTIQLPDPKDPNTRDVLHVKAQIHGEWFHFFVNHWPSRSGGQVESEPNRLAVAQLLKTKVDEVLKSDSEAQIIIMGDFNDHPNDRSIYEVLGAKEQPEATLYNQMYAIHASGNGSYFYKGEWGALDQMITSKGLMDATGWRVDAQSAGVLRDDKILFKDKEGVARPSRSYAGDSYKGGYSDHLPVFMTLRK